MAASVSHSGMDLSQALTTGEFSDLTVKCGGKTFAAHKAIVCMQSPVLRAAFTRNFLEANTGVLDLSEYEPNLVEAFLSFLYSGDYKTYLDPKIEYKISDTALHIGMYCLGDKYDIPKLKNVAKGKAAQIFDMDSDVCDNDEDVIGGILLIYERLPSSDRNLRDLMVLSIRDRMPCIVEDQDDRDRLAEVFKTTPEFSMDLATSYGKHSILLKCQVCGPSPPSDWNSPYCDNCGGRAPPMGL